jgi:hypothetical protein
LPIVLPRVAPQHHPKALDTPICAGLCETKKPAMKSTPARVD